MVEREEFSLNRLGKSVLLQMKCSYTIEGKCITKGSLLKTFPIPWCVSWIFCFMPCLKGREVYIWGLSFLLHWQKTRITLLKSEVTQSEACMERELNLFFSNAERLYCRGILSLYSLCNSDERTWKTFSGKNPQDVELWEVCEANPKTCRAKKHCHW